MAGHIGANMTDLFKNPMGLDGFEFVEFTAPSRGILEPVFESMGFLLVARHKSKQVELWRQGDINFIANYQPKSMLLIMRKNMGHQLVVWRFVLKMPNLLMLVH